MCETKEAVFSLLLLPLSAQAPPERSLRQLWLVSMSDPLTVASFVLFGGCFSLQGSKVLFCFFHHVVFMYQIMRCFIFFFFLLLLKCLTDLLFTVKELLFTVALKLKSLNEKTF